MRSEFWVRAEEGLEGRELTEIEQLDEIRERSLEEAGWFLDVEARAAIQESLVAYCGNVGGR